MQFKLFLCLVFGLELLTFFIRMLGHVLILNESFTFCALRCLNSAHVDVITPLFNLENLLTVGTRFGSEFAALFMLAELTLNRFEAAVLAALLNVLGRLMLSLVRFGDDLPTLRALVVYAGALDLMHPELGFFDLSLTILAEVCLYRLYHSKLITNQQTL